MKSDVFLSCRTHRSAEVEPLISALEGAGLAAWRDQARVRHGQSITVALKKGISLNLLDHVIVGQPFDGWAGYFSFKEAGIIG
jgi:hypothetical protein